jgi:O-antigen ligase
MYDILRGCLYFFTGYFFGAKLQTEKHYPWLLLILAAVLGGNFLFQQGAFLSGSPHAGFYGYHPNPNNSAFVVVAVLAFVLPVLFPPRKSATGLLTGIAGIGMGLMLLYFANSRSAWVAVFLGLTALSFLTLRSKRSLLMLAILTAIILLAVVLLYFNRKGFSMPVRLETWSTLIQITANEHVWLGHGINNTKELLVDTGLPVLIAHNLIVDVFVSTGIIGTMMFVALCFGLLRILIHVNHTDNTAIQTGLSGLVMFGIISMFDLKFSSIVLIGTFAFFSGVIYSQVLKTEDC